MVAMKAPGDEHQSFEDKLIAAAKRLRSRRSRQMEIPIMLQTLNNLQLKVELLQRRAEWQQLNNIEEEYKREDKKGIYVEFADGKSGTFLPVVWQEEPLWACQQFVTAIAFGKSALLTTQLFVLLLHTQPRRYSMQHVNSASPCASPGGCCSRVHHAGGFRLVLCANTHARMINVNKNYKDEYRNDKCVCCSCR